MGSHRPLFLNFIIIAPLFLPHPDFPVEMKWRSNWFSFLLLSSLFSVPESKIARSQKVALLPTIWSHRKKRKTITGKITISIIKNCHNERVWNWRAASMPTPTSCLWGNESVGVWRWPSLSANCRSPGKDVLEEIRITDSGGKRDVERGGRDVRVRETGCRWERRMEVKGSLQKSGD